VIIKDTTSPLMHCYPTVRNMCSSNCRCHFGF